MATASTFEEQLEHAFKQGYHGAVVDSRSNCRLNKMLLKAARQAGYEQGSHDLTEFGFSKSAERTEQFIESLKLPTTEDR